MQPDVQASVAGCTAGKERCKRSHLSRADTRCPWGVPGAAYLLRHMFVTR